jgi:hypothetical protein
MFKSMRYALELPHVVMQGFQASALLLLLLLLVIAYTSHSSDAGVRRKSNSEAMICMLSQSKTEVGSVSKSVAPNDLDQRNLWGGARSQQPCLQCSSCFLLHWCSL